MRTRRATSITPFNNWVTLALSDSWTVYSGLSPRVNPRGSIQGAVYSGFSPRVNPRGSIQGTVYSGLSPRVYPRGSIQGTVYSGLSPRVNPRGSIQGAVYSGLSPRVNPRGSIQWTVSSGLSPRVNPRGSTQGNVYSEIYLYPGFNPESPGPGFFVCFLPVSTPEVSWDQLSWAQVYRFRFFCFCVSWAHREQAHEMTGDREQTGKVSHFTLSKAELCNKGPYLDARMDRISPHTSLLPSHTLPHPQKDPLSRISTSRSSQSLDQSSMICRQVVESNYCLLCDVIYPTSLAQASFTKIM